MTNEPAETVIRDSSGYVLDRWVESDDDDDLEEIHDYSNYRLSVLNNAAQKLRDAIGSALRDSNAV